MRTHQADQEYPGDLELQEVRQVLVHPSVPEVRELNHPLDPTTESKRPRMFHDIEQRGPFVLIHDLHNSPDHLFLPSSRTNESP